MALEDADQARVDELAKRASSAFAESDLGQVRQIYGQVLKIDSTHPAANYMVWSSFSGRARSAAGFRVLLDKVLEVDAEAMGWSSAPGVQDCGGAGPSFDARALTAGFSCNQWEGDVERTRALYNPIMEWCAQPEQKRLGISCDR